MKKTIFTLAFAVIALFGFNVAQAQSLSQYTADFANSTLTVNIAKIGGFGSKTASISVDLYLEMEGTVDCEKWTQGTGTRYNTFNRIATAEEYILVPRGTKNGSLTLNPIEVRRLDASGFDCPSGWIYDQREGQDVNAVVTKVWAVVTALNSEKQPIGTPQVQDLVVSGLPQPQ